MRMRKLGERGRVRKRGRGVMRLLFSKRPIGHPIEMDTRYSGTRRKRRANRCKQGGTKGIERQEDGKEEMLSQGNFIFRIQFRGAYFLFRSLHLPSSDQVIPGEEGLTDLDRVPQQDKKASPLAFTLLSIQTLSLRRRSTPISQSPHTPLACLSPLVP